MAVMRDGGMVDDYFMIHLLGSSKYPDVRITLKAGYLMCGSEPRFVLHGTEGSYIKCGVDKQEGLLRKGLIPNTSEWGIETEDEWGWLYTATGEKRKYASQRGDYIGFYEAVYQHLRHGIPAETDARHILPVIRVIEAAKESSRSKKIVRL
jgi:predicted dehydrogenase